jgi:hypothetical protein
MLYNNDVDDATSLFPRLLVQTTSEDDSVDFAGEPGIIWRGVRAIGFAAA